MEVCAYCEGEGFIMNGLAINHCYFCKGSGVMGGLKNHKKVDIHEKKVPKKPIYKTDKRNI